MHHFHNEQFRYGSSRFATKQEIARAGMFEQKSNSFLVSFAGQRPIFYSGMGGGLIVAGARSGKLRDILAYNICSGTMASATLIVLDPKGELAVIAQNQTPDRKHVIYWNPTGLHGLPKHSINSAEVLHIHNPSLISDAMLWIENWKPLSGSPQGEFFELRAREILLAFILTLVKMHGQLHLKDLHHAVNLIPVAGEEWANFAWEMHNSGFDIARRVEAEINEARNDSTGGFRGILGELFKSMTCLNSPELLESVSPPYDMKLSDLTSSNQAYQLMLMPPAEFIGLWSPVLKSILVTTRIYKSRAPSAPQQTLILDECAKLGRFPLLFDMFSYGAGIGQRPIAVYQSLDQMNETGKDGRAIISSSAALQILFAIREIGSARMVSEMIGDETLNFDDVLKQSLAGASLSEMRHALTEGTDPVAVSRRMIQLAEAEMHRSQMKRRLRAPDEVMRTPDDKAYVFVDGLTYPIYADRRPYYLQRSMAGRFHPNPYVPDQPLDKVRVKTRLGYGWRKVIKEAVPPKFADYPQYSDGTWSRIARW